MGKHPFLISTLLIGLISQFPLWAQDEETLFQFDQITLQGTGCPKDTTAIIPTPDQQTVTFLFDRFQAAVPQQDGNNDNEDISEDNPQRSRRDSPILSHKICVLRVGIRVPVGKLLKSFSLQSDYRGYTYAEKGTKTVFRSLLLDKRGLGAENQPTRNLFLQKNWKPESATPIDEEWTIQENQEIPLRGQCSRRGQRLMQLAVKHVLLAKIVKQNVLRAREIMPKATIQLDSHDIKGKMKLGFRFENCR
jgi:hypothetical protein